MISPTSMGPVVQELFEAAAHVPSGFTWNLRCSDEMFMAGRAQLSIALDVNRKTYGAAVEVTVTGRRVGMEHDPAGWRHILHQQVVRACHQMRLAAEREVAEPPL